MLTMTFGTAKEKSEPRLIAPIRINSPGTIRGFMTFVLIDRFRLIYDAPTLSHNACNESNLPRQVPHILHSAENPLMS